eukprot:8083435-Pyramimonas_sp.AAC.1
MQSPRAESRGFLNCILQQRRQAALTRDVGQRLRPFKMRCRCHSRSCVPILSQGMRGRTDVDKKILSTTTWKLDCFLCTLRRALVGNLAQLFLRVCPGESFFPSLVLARFSLEFSEFESQAM